MCRLDIFKDIYNEISQDRSVVLSTIILQEGPAPRGEGTMMLTGQDGYISGTVGGGRMELLCIEKSAEILGTGSSQVAFFPLNLKSAESIGAVCGGDVKILFTFIGAGDVGWMKCIEELTALAGQNRDAWLELGIKGEEPQVITAPGDIETSETVYTNTPVLLDGKFIIPFEKCTRAIIFGAGHCGIALGPVLMKLGFKVIIFDDREERAEHAASCADQFISGNYADIEKSLHIRPEDFTAVMTHGHTRDYDVMRQLLLMEEMPAYVGMIGSVKKIEFTYEKLRHAGVAEERLAAVHSPIGTKIFAETPDEIAISIAGEFIMERALLKAGGNRKTDVPDFNMHKKPAKV